MARVKIKESKLDAIFSQIMRSRGKCDFCGRGREHGVVLQCAHGFSRRYRGTRWTEEANFCLCSGCHMKFTHDPIGWDDYMQATWGEEKYNRLRAQAQAITKADREEILEKLKKRLEEINAGDP